MNIPKLGQLLNELFGTGMFTDRLKELRQRCTLVTKHSKEVQLVSANQLFQGFRGGVRAKNFALNGYKMAPVLASRFDVQASGLFGCRE